MSDTSNHPCNIRTIETLGGLASALVSDAEHLALQPELLILHRSANHRTNDSSCSWVTTSANSRIDADIELEIRPLLGADPVAELIGLRADPSWAGVGVRSPAMSRRIDGGDGSACTLVHLLDRDGISVTHLRIDDHETIELGPDRSIREGRIPDACRRIFALPTAAPPADMWQFVLDAWLAKVLRSALLAPGLSWSAVVELSFVHHLGTISGTATPSPASMAGALLDASITLDWDRYRSVCITLGSCPVSELTGPQIEWMDTGMFARWTHGSLPCTAELLDLLEPTLEPTAFDRLWATVSFTRPSHGTSDR